MNSIKKLSIVIVLLCFTVTLQAQQPLLDTAKVTMSKVYKDVKEAVTGLSSALKVGVEHVYEVLVKQQVVNSITYLTISIVLLGLCYPMIKLGIKLKSDNSYWDDNIAILPLALGIISGILGIVVLIITIQPIVMGFVNPEYGAMQDILNFIKH